MTNPTEPLSDAALAPHEHRFGWMHDICLNGCGKTARQLLPDALSRLRLAEAARGVAERVMDHAERLIDEAAPDDGLCEYPDEWRVAKDEWREDFATYWREYAPARAAEEGTRGSS